MLVMAFMVVVIMMLVMLVLMMVMRHSMAQRAPLVCQLCRRIKKAGRCRDFRVLVPKVSVVEPALPMIISKWALRMTVLEDSVVVELTVAVGVRSRMHRFICVGEAVTCRVFRPCPVRRCMTLKIMVHDMRVGRVAIEPIGSHVMSRRMSWDVRRARQCVPVATTRRLVARTSGRVPTSIVLVRVASSHDLGIIFKVGNLIMEGGQLLFDRLKPLRVRVSMYPEILAQTSVQAIRFLLQLSAPVLQSADLARTLSLSIRRRRTVCTVRRVHRRHLPRRRPLTRRHATRHPVAFQLHLWHSHDRVVSPGTQSRRVRRAFGRPESM